MIKKCHDSFETGVYRKKTFTGLGTKFNSDIMCRYKSNLIECMVDRAYKLCCNYLYFTVELDFIRQFLMKNRFPYTFVEKYIGLKLNKIFSSDSPILSVPRNSIYCSLPYLNRKCNNIIKKDLNQVVSEFFPQLELKLIFNNKCTIGSFFKFKDQIPSHMVSDVVYYYKCSQCGADYCGETTRHFKSRVADHRGVSARTNRTLNNNVNSTIFNHSIDHDHPIDSRNFKIIAISNSIDIRITESVLIHKIKPSLNRADSSIPLNILV